MTKNELNHEDPLSLSWQSSIGMEGKVYIGRGTLSKLTGALSEIRSDRKVLIVKPQSKWSNDTGDIKTKLKDHGFSVHEFKLPDGEVCKSISCLTEIWDILYRLQFTRRDSIVAVGGGSVTDIAGFAAATYLRGINLVSVPTTLLSQVDAAIGGKTAVNFHQGKNLIGAFYFAKTIIIDTDFLTSLPRRQFVSGLAEIVKCSLIEKTVAAESEYQSEPKNLYDVLAGGIKDLAWDSTVLSSIIAACIKMKLCVVKKDPLESGLRYCLNFGHTLGHALESTSNFSLNHGEAVSIGMSYALHMAVSQGRLTGENEAKALSLIKAAGLPTVIPQGITARDLLDALYLDKKKEGEAIRMVLPQGNLGCVDCKQLIARSEIEKTLIDFSLP